MSAPADTGVALELRGITKRYPGTLAVDGVDLKVYAGEIHALVGENGAGKSTLVKVLAGAFGDYTGQVTMNGRPVLLHSPAASRAVGIQMIHQELSLAGPLSVAENVLVGRLPTRAGVLVDWRAARAEAVESLARVGLELDPGAAVESLSQHEAQLVEIAKALGNKPCILLLDEPTSALGREEVERLFGILRRLRAAGLAIIYISHHLAEVLEISDRVTVMRDGRRVTTEVVGDVTAEDLARLMVGRSVGDLYAERSAPAGPEKVQVHGLSRRGFFRDVSFGVAAGEIVGLGGLSGAGRSELARSLCGIDPRDAGDVCLDGRLVRPRSYRQAIRAGICYLTEDRKTEGLALRLSVGDNLLAALLPSGGWKSVRGGRRARGQQASLVESLRIIPPDPARSAGALSGGNQQKVLLGKWLATRPEFLILDEPTRGVDVGAKVVIHRAVAELANQGKAVLLISSDLAELVGLSDRVLVMRRGRLVAELQGPDCRQEAVLLAAGGAG